MSTEESAAGSERRSTPVQSIDRAATALSLLARDQELGVSEVAHELGVHKSTAFRLLAALEQRGLVEQSGGRGKYRLGYGMARLAGAASAQLDVTRESYAACRALADELGEGVNVAVMDDTQVIHVSQVRGRSSISAYNWVGEKTPVHATSSGKVLLAHQPDAVVDTVLARPLERFTEATVCDPERLREECTLARERGWASTSEEYEQGLNAVACPVRGHGGAVLAAISISGPSYRLPPNLLSAVAWSVEAAANEVSRRLRRLA